DAQENYDVVLSTLPKGRDLWRLLFLYSFRALREGGRLYLAGANDEGIKSAIKDCAALFGAEVLLTYKRGNRVVSFTRGAGPGGDLPASYRAPGIANGTFNEFEIQAQDESFIVCTRPGVFSWRGLDVGTRLLLDVLDVHVTDVVFDVGCGYGVIGLAAARRAVNGQVTLVDVDWLACECARASLSRNGLERAEVLLGDGLAAVAGHAFTLIVSNPPFHSGHAVDYDVVESFVHEAHKALKPRGRLVIVANRFLPYDRLMAQLFGSVTRLAETPQYHVLSAEKSQQRKPRGKDRRAGYLSHEGTDQHPDDW
ncbi:MAG: class I SAM-dependent methyltransferase, partial [Chloroflexi bacterium]|nr:class I SAM-dependent methyltransferase [Chloroflexota bacterium]